MICTNGALERRMTRALGRCGYQSSLTNRKTKIRASAAAAIAVRRNRSVRFLFATKAFSTIRLVIIGDGQWRRSLWGLSLMWFPADEAQLQLISDWTLSFHIHRFSSIKHRTHLDTYSHIHLCSIDLWCYFISSILLSYKQSSSYWSTDAFPGRIQIYPSIECKSLQSRRWFSEPDSRLEMHLIHIIGRMIHDI